jgi:plastocyanin
MKKFFGLCILVILLVAASGCTQPAKTATVTLEPTTLAVTEVPTPEATMPPAPVETTAIPTITTTTVAVTNEVTQIPTTVATPKPVMTPSTKVTIIHIRNNTFVPQELTVLPGTGITWINDDTTVHSIRTMPTSPFKFNSGDVMPGTQWGYTYGENEGTFGFIDTYTNATGMIIVKKGESVLGAPTIKTPAPTTTTV